MKNAIMRVQQQAVQAWLDIAERMAQNPMFLEQGGEEAKQLLARAEGLQMVRRQLFSVMAPPRLEMEPPPTSGRFQFVEWAQEPTQYWVLDTATGGLERRQAPH